ncbi:MAG: ORF6N domain-containing protein [Draconibacterium sp.]
MDNDSLLSKVFELRGENVILDLHLAAHYNIELDTLKKIVLNNIGLLSRKFVFKLTKEEYEFLGNCFVIPVESEKDSPLITLPFAFTAQGVKCLETQLRSARAQVIGK